MEIALRVNQLKQSFTVADGTTKEVLKGINFSIPKGALTGFIGINGAGKTTTIKSLLGFIKAQEGGFEFFGEKGLTTLGRRKLGFMPERPYFYDFLTGHEFLSLHWKLRGLAINEEFEKRCDTVLAAVDLARAKYWRLRQFSKGMLQRIGIAQAIMHSPELLILDEPMSGLDPDGRVLVKNIIKDLHAKGTTIFFSSHLLQDMEELCDRLVIIDKGTIIYEGSLLELDLNGIEEFTMTIARLDGNLETLTVNRRDLQQTIDLKRKENYQITQIIPQKRSLEEAFIDLRRKRASQ
ncbi:MAG: hypothetical protein RJB66_571 [Pseudomonadota bacterium]|jgi:ABC-2 type transport system ATP-binding protein